MILWLELRRALRAILREPTVTVPAVLALGLGIGLPTAMFGLVDATILRGLPIDDPRSVMHRNGGRWAPPAKGGAPPPGTSPAGGSSSARSRSWRRSARGR